MCVFWNFFFRRSRLRLRLLLLVAVHRSLAADQLDLAVLFPQVGHRVAVQDGVEPQVRAQQRHVPEHGCERVETTLSLNEVVRIVPGGSAKEKEEDEEGAVIRAQPRKKGEEITFPRCGGGAMSLCTW